MELSISNIKFFDNYKTFIDVDNFNHILMYGYSGIGKTTIMDCIYYAITGQGFTNKWSLKYKNKQGWVTLEFCKMGLHIKRSLNPKSIEVQFSGKVTTGGEAELVLSDVFSKFKYTGYLRQKSTYSYFISMTPKDRMIFIEGMLFEEMDVDAVKQRIKNTLDDYKKKFIQAEQTLNDVEKIKIYKMVTYSTLMASKCDIENTRENISQLEEECGKLLQSNVLKKELVEQRAKCKEELTMVYNQNENIEAFIKKHESKLSSYKKDIATYQDYILLYDKYKQFNKQIESKLSEINTELESIKKGMVDINLLENDIQTKKHMMDTYKDYLEVKESIKKLNFDEKEYKNTIKTYNSLYLYQSECPSCSTLLNVYGNKLCKADTKDNSEENVKFLILKSNIEAMRAKEIKHKVLVEKLDHLYSKISQPVCTQAELNSKIELKANQVKLKERYDELGGKLKTMNWSQMTKPKPIKVTEEQYLRYLNKVELYSTFTVKLEYTSKLEKTLEGKMDDLERRIEELDCDLDLYEDKACELEGMKKKLGTLESDYTESEKIYKYTTALEKLNVAKQNYVDACEFQKIFIKTQSDIMMYTLNSINVIIKKYLDGFFDLKIDFSFYINHDKNCIDTVLSYGECIPADLSILSGGEYDRIVLAVSLAFAEFFKLPILLLDEVTNSLDMNTCQVCLEHVQKVYPDNQTVIYIGHQIITGLFDSSINLDEGEK